MRTDHVPRPKGTQGTPILEDLRVRGGSGGGDTRQRDLGPAR